jgi:small subunit ribosomal protein S20
MPNKPAAKKYLKVSKKRHERNLKVKKELKTIIKKVLLALEDSSATKKAEELLKDAVKIIDRAAQKKIIKKNTAARKKKRLFKKLRTGGVKPKAVKGKAKKKK